MVSIRNIVSLLALSVPVIAQTTPAQVVDNIKALTQKSQALQVPAARINIINGPLVIIGLGPIPQVIFGFADIVTTATTSLAQMRGMPAVPPGNPSDLIFDAFRDFVRVHQVLLNILIGKAGLFSTVPFIGTPVAAALREIEKIVDTVAFALIGAVQSRANDLQAQAGLLKGTISTGIDSYDGLSLKKRAPGVAPISRVKRGLVAAY